MRNPFPRIGKVMKYDFKHSSRTLLPLFGALLILGLLTGLFAFPGTVFDKQTLEFIQNNSSNPSVMQQIISAILTVALCVLNLVCFVMTIVSIARRFKMSMLEDEAYVNLSLPVTMGEHLWGKFLTSFIWCICCAIVDTLAGFLCFIRMGLPSLFKEFFEILPEIQENLNTVNLSIGKLFWLGVLSFCALSFFIITLIFVVNAISHLFKKHKGFVKFITVVVLLYIDGWLFKLVPTNPFAQSGIEMSKAFTTGLVVTSLITIAISAVYFAATQIIFNKKLNLE